MNEFNAINRETDLSEAACRKVPWDIVLSDGTEYDVYEFTGYVHTIGGRWDDNSYYACPRGEKPTAENLVLFRANSTCRWGFVVTEESYLKHKWGETYIDDHVVATILRNDRPFKTIRCNDMGYATSCALKFITDVQEGGLDVNYINWDKSILGSKIYYGNTPAIIRRVDTNDFRIYIEPANEERCFPKPAFYFNDYTDAEWEREYGRGMYVDADSAEIHWRIQSENDADY